MKTKELKRVIYHRPCVCFTLIARVWWSRFVLLVWTTSKTSFAMPAQHTMISCCDSHRAVYDWMPYTESGKQLVPQMNHNCHTSRYLELQLRKKHHSYLDSSTGGIWTHLTWVEHENIRVWIEHENIKSWTNKSDI